jgi:hypothetical protein
MLSLPLGPAAEQGNSKSKTATKGKRGGGAAAGSADPPAQGGETGASTSLPAAA